MSKEIQEAKKNLQKINKVCGNYKATDLKKDLESLTAKDRILFFLKMTELVLNHQDLLKDESEIENNNTIKISFV